MPDGRGGSRTGHGGPDGRWLTAAPDRLGLRLRRVREARGTTLTEVGDQDLVLGVGGAAELDTHVPQAQPHG